jgi:hypothetical protein
MNRQLAKWNPYTTHMGGYRRCSGGMYMKRAHVIVDGREAGIFGIGSSLEQADAALKSFIHPNCVCFPGDSVNCPIHPLVEVLEHEEECGLGLPSLRCKFRSFDKDYERWPSSGEDKNGNIDYDMLEKWGWKWEETGRQHESPRAR